MEAYINGVKVVGTPEEIAIILSKLDTNTVRDKRLADPLPIKNEADVWSCDWPGDI